MRKIINEVYLIIIDYCLHNKGIMIDYDSFLTTISEKDRARQSTQVKFISAKKWQNFMIESLKNMMNRYHQKKNIIVDLITIVSSVPEVSFVQATLKIRPFQPQFTQALPILSTVIQQNQNQTKNGKVKFSPCKIQHHEDFKKRMRTTQKTLAKQFNKDYHPFKFIVNNFKRLLELKFKSLVDSKKVKNNKSLHMELKSDMEIFTQFLHKVSQPYKKLFTSPSLKGQQEQNKNFQQFLDTFISENQTLNKCIFKIICYACKAFYQKKIDETLRDFANPQDFQLPEDFKIDGGYIRTINSFMEFSECLQPEKAMKKLKRIRQNILIDINQYYVNHTEQKQLQVNAEVQIEIIRFCITKLKGWANQIFAQIKFLEFVYGDEQMGYKYQQSSYMYTQISMAYQIMQIDNI